jgi:hypothetical protein
MATRSDRVILVSGVIGLCMALGVGFGNGAVLGAEAERPANERGLVESKDAMVAAYKDAVARVVSVLADEKIRESDRATTVAAIELAGTLRAKEAVPHLVDCLLYGRTHDITDVRVRRRLLRPPHARAPAVQALIDIGMPSLEAVRGKLVSASRSKRTITTCTLRLHCVWVVWKVLGTDLGKEYLVLWQEKDPEPKAWFDDMMGFFKAREDMEKAAVKGKAATKNED